MMNVGRNNILIKAVGKAIAAVITLAAKEHPGKTHQYLEKIAAQAKDNWVKIAQQELTQQRYPELREALGGSGGRNSMEADAVEHSLTLAL